MTTQLSSALLKLTLPSGNPIRISPLHIVSVLFPDDAGSTLTPEAARGAVSVTTDLTYLVRETPDEIMALIDGIAFD